MIYKNVLAGPGKFQYNCLWVCKNLINGRMGGWRVDFAVILTLLPAVVIFYLKTKFRAQVVGDRLRETIIIQGRG
jgi:hypothetical protein